MLQGEQAERPPESFRLTCTPVNDLALRHFPYLTVASVDSVLRAGEAGSAFMLLHPSMTSHFSGASLSDQVLREGSQMIAVCSLLCISAA